MRRFCEICSSLVSFAEISYDLGIFICFVVSTDCVWVKKSLLECLNSFFVEIFSKFFQKGLAVCFREYSLHFFYKRNVFSCGIFRTFDFLQRFLVWTSCCIFFPSKTAFSMQFLCVWSLGSEDFLYSPTSKSNPQIQYSRSQYL